MAALPSCVQKYVWPGTTVPSKVEIATFVGAVRSGAVAGVGLKAPVA